MGDAFVDDGRTGASARPGKRRSSDVADGLGDAGGVSGGVSTGADLRTTKRELRKQLRARRKGLVAARDADADARDLAAHALALLADRGLGAGSTVTLYASWEGEPPTGALLAALQDGGFRVLLPITLPDLDLDWFDADDPGRTPLGLDAVAAADLVLAPGLAVDPTGTRMGQGGGCYDKAIPRLRPGTPVVVLLHPGEYGEPRLPREAHDAPVGGVLTAEGFAAVPS